MKLSENKTLDKRFIYKSQWILVEFNWMNPIAAYYVLIMQMMAVSFALSFKLARSIQVKTPKINGDT